MWKKNKILTLSNQISYLLLITNNIYNQNIDTTTKLVKVEQQNE